MRGNMEPALHSYELEATMAELLTGRRFPKQWYQGNGARIGFAFLITTLGYLSVFVFRLQPPLAVSAASLAVLFLGVLMDVTTTHRLTLMKKHFDSRGLAFPFREENPLLSDIPTLKELIWGKPSLLAVLAGLIICFVPLAGWGIAASLFAVSLNNHRNRQQAIYELRLYDTMLTRGGEKERDTRIRGISLPSRPILARDSEKYVSLA